MKGDLKDLVEELKKAAVEQNGQLYIVGGYVRDKLMDPNSTPKDIDFIYSGDIYKLMERLTLKGYKFYPVKEEEGIFGTVISGFRADISIMKGSTIDEDLKKRDFTVNANALNLLDMKIVDPFKGRRALKSRILQETTEKSLEDDPVRILRGIRLYIKYGFHFSIHTEEHIAEFAYLLKEAKGERVLNELMGIIQCDKDGRAFELLDNYKILENLLPYVNELKTIGKSDFKSLDVFSHMDLCYKTYKELLAGLIILKNADLSLLNRSVGNYSLGEYLGFSCFIHDIGKYESLENYNEAGAGIAEKLCLELKFPKEASNMVTNIIKNHRWVVDLFNIIHEKIQLAEVFKFFKSNGSLVPFILIASFCDNYAEKIIYDPADEKKKYKNFIEKLFTLFGVYNSIITNNWVNGEFIMEKTSISGKEIRIILDKVNELIFLGGIKSKSEAQKYIISKYGGVVKNEDIY